MSNMVLCCLISSVIVSYVGLINFIGLIAPHIVRLVVGNNHAYLIPGSAMAGALILLLGDLFSLPLLLWLTPYRRVAHAAFYDARQAMPEAAAQDLPPL